MIRGLPKSILQKSIIVTAVLASLFCTQSAFCQDASPEMPATRPKFDELNKESSSFVPDPDSLDPLPLKKESLKEDEEPALDDIKSILKTKPKPKPKSDTKRPKKKTSRKAKVKAKAATTDFSSLSPDDPDLSLEQKFNDYYIKHNINPTPDEIWGKVTASTANIYVVQKGDTLSTISRTLFGDTQFWPKIWALNNAGITNPHFISPGTKIYFYPGDGGQAPSLSVGVAQKEIDQNIGLVQNTEFNKLVAQGSSGPRHLRSLPGLQPIPASLPHFAGTAYYQKPLEAQFAVTPVSEYKDREPINPFILTAAPLKTAYRVLEKNASALVCKDNHYVPVVIKLGKDAQPGRYSMLVPETFNFGRLKKTHIYRIIGEADVSEDDSMRISQCINPINTDVLLVTTEQMETVKPPSEILPNTRSQIIEGVEVIGQQYYYSHQYLILNMSQLPALEGTDLKVYSASVGGVVGEIRILKRTGTMAVGYILNSNDVIQVGDRVIIPE